MLDRCGRIAGAFDDDLCLVVGYKRMPIIADIRRTCFDCIIKRRCAVTFRWPANEIEVSLCLSR